MKFAVLILFIFSSFQFAFSSDEKVFRCGGKHGKKWTLVTRNGLSMCFRKAEDYEYTSEEKSALNSCSSSNIKKIFSKPPLLPQSDGTFINNGLSDPMTSMSGSHEKKCCEEIHICDPAHPNFDRENEKCKVYHDPGDVECELNNEISVELITQTKQIGNVDLETKLNTAANYVVNPPAGPYMYAQEYLPEEELEGRMVTTDVVQDKGREDIMNELSSSLPEDYDCTWKSSIPTGEYTEYKTYKDTVFGDPDGIGPEGSVWVDVFTDEKIQLSEKITFTCIPREQPVCQTESSESWDFIEQQTTYNPGTPLYLMMFKNVLPSICFDGHPYAYTSGAGSCGDTLDGQILRETMGNLHTRLGNQHSSLPGNNPKFYTSPTSLNYRYSKDNLDLFGKDKYGGIIAPKKNDQRRYVDAMEVPYFIYSSCFDPGDTVRRKFLGDVALVVGDKKIVPAVGADRGNATGLSSKPEWSAKIYDEMGGRQEHGCSVKNVFPSSFLYVFPRNMLDINNYATYNGSELKLQEELKKSKDLLGVKAVTAELFSGMAKELFDFSTEINMSPSGPKLIPDGAVEEKVNSNQEVVGGLLDGEGSKLSTN